MWVTAPLEADSSEVFLPCSVPSLRHTNSRGVRMTVILSLRTPRLELSRGRCLAQQGPSHTVGGRWQVWAQVPGFLPPTCEICMEWLASQPLGLGAGGELAAGRFLSASPMRQAEK